MGTYCEVRAWGPPGKVAPALDRALDRIAQLERVLTTWSADGELAALNARLAGASRAAVYPVSSDLARALAVARRWAERSGGRFDPTVGVLSRAWGLGEGGREPTAGELAAAAARTGWRHYTVDPGRGRLRTLRTGLQFDLGGIGKGFALDEAARVLAARGLDGALFNFGGQVLATGPPPGERGWVVALADPRRRDRVMATVFVERGSVATSGASERYLTVGSARHAEIIDPLSGRPLPATGAVSVITPSATDADALSTALFGYRDPRAPGFLPPGTRVLWLTPNPAAGQAASRSFRQ
ncbi:MAG: FAD:protein FMN transferase [Acidobacteriota bacterium]|nr:FAD:protein FMN transferase [Acidobacteriota bacterium]MDQ7087040.1 FAD:protein FMN transferase [Acidobacteriota bacterium]